jgi:hypothetical protein
MKYKKDNRQEVIVIEIAAWALVIGILYLFTRAIFSV